MSLLDGDNVASGAATVYTYDARNLKTSEAFPGHGPTSNIGDVDYDLVGFSYDAAGRVLVKTDQQGDLCTFNYDLAGRLTSRDYLGGPLSPLVGQSDSDSFVYDAAGRMTAAVSGRYNNTVAMSYDAASRLVGESLTAFAQTYTVGSGFDAANRKTSITYPDGTLVERGYTDRNQLSQIKYAGAIIDTRTYDSGGRLTTSLYGNNIGTTWTYRADNLTASITRTNLTGADFSYTYDANKNKTSETISGVMAPYGFLTTSYDNQDRLTAWNRTDGALNQSWNLSNEGDWNSFTQNTITQNRTHGPTHELTAIDSVALTYDSKGNLTQNSNGHVYTWDFDNRLSSATVPPGATQGIVGTHTYTYDALGRRVSKAVAGAGTTVFVCKISPLQYSPSAGQVLAEYPSGALPASPDRKYAYASYIDDPVLLVDRTSLGSLPAGTDEPFYYHKNSLYSVAVLTASTATIIERYSYTAYGATTFRNAGGAPLPTQTSTISNPFTYTARRIDQETNLHYYRARYFDNTLGRFIVRDPIGFESGSANHYRFVGGHPLNALDPSGNRAILCRAVHGIYGWLFKHCEYADECTSGIEVDPIYGNINVSCYPIWRDWSGMRALDDGTPCGCASDAGIDACIKRHPSGRPLKSKYGSNCQSDTIETISSCCLKTSWPPDWYAGPRGTCLRWEQRGNPLSGYYQECVEWSSGICLSGH